MGETIDEKINKLKKKNQEVHTINEKRVGYLIEILKHTNNDTKIEMDTRNEVLKSLKDELNF